MTTIAAARSGPANAQAPPSSHVQSHPYTCNSCQVAFRNSELQRSHMRTDWHRYNLKRRVASLPPLSSEIFAEKVLNAQATTSAAAAKASFERICTACQKTYYSENAFQNHLGSQKHRLRAAAQAKEGVDDETASVMSSTISLGDSVSIEPAIIKPDPPAEPIDAEAEAEFSKVISGIKDSSLGDEPVSRRPTRPHHSSEAKEHRSEHPLSPPHKVLTSDAPAQGAPKSEIPLNRCLFCNYDSPTFKLCVMHMTKYHSMFIPEQTYLVNLEGLITWLYSRIHDLHECLYCHKVRSTAEAVQTHMRDVGHCKIAFEEEQDMIEVGQFYDFSSTYSDPEGSDMDEEEENDDDDGDDVTESKNDNENGGVRLGGSDKRKVLKTIVSDENGDIELANGDENGEGWETDSSASSVDSAELTAIPLDRRHMYKQERLQSHRHHSHDDPRPHRAADGFHSHAHSHHAAFYSDHELHLPTGRTAGHRSLNRYFRQNLRNHPSPAERVEQQRLLEEAKADGDEDEAGDAGDSERGRQLITRANGGLGMMGVTDAKKKEVQAVEKREARKAQRAERQYEWGINKRANNQKHFRDPLLQ